MNGLRKALGNLWGISKEQEKFNVSMKNSVGNGCIPFSRTEKRFFDGFCKWKTKLSHDKVRSD